MYHSELIERRLSNVKAVATDVDGTLSISRDDYRLDIEAINAIRDLESNGIKVIFISGNSLPLTVGLARYCGASGPVVAENGCIVYYKGKIIPVVRESAKSIADEVARVFKEYIEPSWQNPYRQFDYAFRIKREYKSRVFEVCERISRYIESRGYDSQVKVMYSGFALHIIPRSGGKSVGLKVACELANVKLENVVGVGDSVTDIELLQTVGIPVAVANADLELKKIAKYITSKPSGKGFAELAKIILTNPQQLLKQQ